eukprot:NODE_424_length_7676_cov_0.895209.p6 type:complete len:188 gc:universal NODE_424_length_7676_cov_0.895209:1900-1337(-)
MSNKDIKQNRIGRRQVLYLIEPSYETGGIFMVKRKLEANMHQNCKRQHFNTSCYKFTNKISNSSTPHIKFEILKASLKDKFIMVVYNTFTGLSSKKVPSEYPKYMLNDITNIKNLQNEIIRIFSSIENVKNVEFSSDEKNLDTYDTTTITSYLLKSTLTIQESSSDKRFPSQKFTLSRKDPWINICF